MTRFAPALFLSAALFALPALGGDCTSDLAIDVQGDLQSGVSITVDVTNSLPDASTFLVVGENQGSTTIGIGPFGSLTLGIEAPFVVFPLGNADGNGAASAGFSVAAVPIQIDPIVTNAQAVAFDVTIGGGAIQLDTCTSNVVTVTIQ